MIRVLPLVSLLGCQDSLMEVPPSVSLADPRVPYSRVWTATFDREVGVHLVATDGGSVRQIDAKGAEVRVDLVALGAGRTWTVSGTASAGRDSEALPEVSFTTDPLPEPFPTLTLRATSDAVEPGLTLLSLRTGDGTASYVAAVDAAGEVAWLFRSGDTVDEVSMRDGHLLVQTWDAVREMAWSGETVALWALPGAVEAHVELGLPNLHHELFQTPDGTFATLANEFAEVADFPVSYDDPSAVADARVMGDRIVEVDPVTGATLGEWSAFELLDPHRIGYDSLNDYGGAYDWSHSNAIAYDAERETWIVSSRNQDAVYAFDREGALAWLLAPPANWAPPQADALLTPVGAVQLPYKQHALEWSDGRLLLFDNAYVQASPWTGEPGVAASEVSSRLVELRVDPLARTVEQLWEWHADPPLFSASLGDADRLANGNVLGVWGDVRYEGGQGGAALGRGLAWARVVEIDPVSGDTAWDLDVWAPSGSDQESWRVYRAERVPDPR